MEKLQHDILDFIHLSGSVTRSELASQFPHLTYHQLTAVLNELIASSEVDPDVIQGAQLYRAVKDLNVARLTIE